MRIRNCLSVGKIREKVTMKKSELKALKGSIAKWRKIEEGTGDDNGEKNCPLCIEHRILPGLVACDECIIAQSVSGDCYDTPYGSWAFHHDVIHKSQSPLAIECPKCEELAMAELTFLESLLSIGYPQKIQRERGV